MTPDPEVPSMPDSAHEVEAVELPESFNPHTSPGGVPAAIEAVLMVIDEPVTEVQLATALEIPVEEIASALESLAAEYYGVGAERPRGFELRHVAGGWRVFSHPAYAPVVNRFVLDGQTARLTQAALETLAVVAYRQPISRGRISAIRGVNVDGVVRTLVSRGLVEESGMEFESGAVLYQTSSYFMERMGLSSLDDLPPLAPYLPDMDGLNDIDEE